MRRPANTADATAPNASAKIEPISAGVVIVRRNPEGGDSRWLCLMLRVYRDWDFPKGRIDPGETAFEAAVREAAEEATVSNLAFDWGQCHRDTAPYSGGKVARYFLARVDSDRVKLGINPVLGRPEHHEYRWMTLAEARSLARARLHPIIDWAAEQLRSAA